MAAGIGSLPRLNEAPMPTTAPPISAAEAFNVRSSVSDRRPLSLAERARERLRAKSYRQLWMIVCEFHEGLLTLRGVVNSYYLKQVAQAAVVGLDGVEEIANRVEVCYLPAESRPTD
jgi:osmotically-inducible protein OsmY